MPKDVQMSIKMEAGLRARFMAVAASSHRPAAQIVRELMRAYLERQEVPNAETLAAMDAVERGETVTHAGVEDLFQHLGI